MEVIAILMFIHHTTCEGADELFRALDIASQMSPFVLIAVHSNGHSFFWGLTESNLDKKGDFVEGRLNEVGFLVSNTQDFPTNFYGDMGQSL